MEIFLAACDLLDEFLRRTEGCLFQSRITVDGGKLLRDGVNVSALETEPARSSTVLARNKHAQPVPRETRHLTDRAHRTHEAQIVPFGKLLFGIGLSRHKDVFIVGVRALERRKRNTAPHIESHRRVGEHDLRPHGNDGQYFDSVRVHAVTSL